MSNYKILQFNHVFLRIGILDVEDKVKTKCLRKNPKILYQDLEYL